MVKYFIGLISSIIIIFMFGLLLGVYNGAEFGLQAVGEGITSSYANFFSSIPAILSSIKAGAIGSALVNTLFIFSAFSFSYAFAYIFAGIVNFITPIPSYYILFFALAILLIGSAIAGAGLPSLGLGNHSPAQPAPFSNNATLQNQTSDGGGTLPLV